MFHQHFGLAGWNSPRRYRGAPRRYRGGECYRSGECCSTHLKFSLAYACLLLLRWPRITL